MTDAKPVGLTAAAGFQIGVRRTLSISQEHAWELLTSPAGLALWLGELPDGFSLTAGQAFQSAEGLTGQLRIVKPLQQLRLAWQLPEWEAPSTLQIRLLSSQPAKTTISFHQEKLIDAQMRERMKLRWETVLERLSEQAGQ